MNIIHTTWLTGSAIVAANTIEGAMRDAESIAQASGPTILALILIVCGVVIVAFDRRREKASADERMERRQQFTEVLQHHKESVTAWREERAELIKTNTEVAKALMATLETNARVMTELSERVSGCPVRPRQ